MYFCHLQNDKCKIHNLGFLSNQIKIIGFGEREKRKEKRNK